MEIWVIGSGGALYSTLDRQSGSCFLLILIVGGKKILVLLDAGYGTLAKAIKMGVDISNIDAIFISHLHMDHDADLAAFIHCRYLFAKKEALARKKQPQLKKLWVYGPDGVKDAFEGALGLLGDPDFKPGSNDIDFFQGPDDWGLVQTVEVIHGSEKALAFVCSDDSGQLIYTGDINDDMRNDKALSVVANDPVIITDATGFGDLFHRGVTEVLRLGRICKARKMFLVHTRLDFIKTVEEWCRLSNGWCVRAVDELILRI